MLSYQHTYHAGNFADVHKHLVLSRLLAALCRKDKPWCYLESHAGRGAYTLHSAAAQKTGEYADGIARVWSQPAPELAKPYLQRVKDLNARGGLQVYPGSPLVAQHWLREQDRMVLMELHPQEHEALKALFQSGEHADARVAVHHRDGFEGLPALTPPAQKRGLVLIDPSYELKEDYRRVPELLVALARRWSTGIFAVWYPLLAAGRHRDLLRAVERSGLRKVLVSELQVRGEPRDDAPGGGMLGSGMLMVNAPFQLDQELEALSPWLQQHLAQDAGASASVSWLVGE